MMHHNKIQKVAKNMMILVNINVMMKNKKLIPSNKLQYKEI